jgi:hypothetical protein
MLQEAHDSQALIGRVAAVLEALAGAGGRSRRRPSSGTTGTGCSGTIGGRILAIGGSGRSTAWPA